MPPTSVATIPGLSSRQISPSMKVKASTPLQRPPRIRRNATLSARKSCDACYLHKKKCDGDGVNSCRRCIRKGDGRLCRYSIRKRKTKRQQPHVPSPPKRDCGDARDVWQCSSSSSLKRCTFSASPATGLIGMKENAFLSDFLASFGFLPITSHREITGAVVRLIGAGRESSAQPAGFEQRFLEKGEHHTAVGNERDPSVSRLPAPAGQLQDPPIGVFWAAVALGGLVKGHSVDRVSAYISLAEGILESNRGRPSSSLVRVLVTLAYVYAIAGHPKKFITYMQRADVALREASQLGLKSPPGFTEMVQHRNSVKRHLAAVDADELESLRDESLDVPRLADVVTESDLYRFFMHVYQAVEQSFFMDVGSQKTVEGDYQDESTQARVVMNGTCGARLRACLRESERLEDAVDRPRIRRSVGGILINGMIIAAKALKRDRSGELDRLTYCVEFLEQYPGMCKWLHTPHVMAHALAPMATEESRARDLYDRLRIPYNLYRHSTFPQMPPLEEWSGDAVKCDHFYCRSLRWIMASDQAAVASLHHLHHSPFVAAHGGVPDVELVRGEELTHPDSCAHAMVDSSLTSSSMKVSASLSAVIQGKSRAVGLNSLSGRTLEPGPVCSTCPAQEVAARIWLSDPVLKHTSDADDKLLACDLAAVSSPAVLMREAEALATEDWLDSTVAMLKAQDAQACASYG